MIFKLKKKKRKVKEGKSSVEPNDADDILHENLDEETLNGKIASELPLCLLCYLSIMMSNVDIFHIYSWQIVFHPCNFHFYRSIVIPEIFFSLIIDVHIFYAADVNQLAAESEVMDIGEPEKAKKRKKNKTSRLLYFYPKQRFSQLSALYCINICVSWHAFHALDAEKVKQSGEVNRTDMQVSVREDNLEEHEVDTADVDEIASVDEDCSRGMKSNVYTSGFYCRKDIYFH